MFSTGIEAEHWWNVENGLKMVISLLLRKREKTDAMIWRHSL